MAEDSQLPALISQTSLDVGSFDEWKTDDLIGWLQRATVTLVAAEKWTDQHRLNVGAALYALRERLKEGDYGKAVSELATSLKITTRTLANWRRLYEEARQLPPPGPAVARTEAQRQRQLRNSVHKSEEQQEEKAGVIEARAEEIPNTHLSGLEPDEPTGEAPPAPAPTPPAPPSAKDENKAVADLLRPLLAVDPAVLSRAVKRPELIKMEGLAKRAQQANADDGSRVVLLAPDLVARLAVAPSEPFDAGVNRAIRDLLAEVERLRQSTPVQPAPSPPPATKVKIAATKKAPKPPAVKRPKPGEPCPHPVEAHDGLDMSGVTCTWCGESALTIVSLLRMGERAMAAAK